MCLCAGMWQKFCDRYIFEIRTNSRNSMKHQIKLARDVNCCWLDFDANFPACETSTLHFSPELNSGEFPGGTSTSSMRCPSDRFGILYFQWSTFVIYPFPLTESYNAVPRKTQKSLPGKSVWIQYYFFRWYYSLYIILFFPLCLMS